MNLALITKTEIVEKIFTLICKKLSLDLIVTQSVNFEEKVDFIIVDEEFVDDDFNKFRANSKKLAAITSEDLPFDKARDFIIKRPFLPTYLESVLKEQIKILEKTKTSEKVYIENQEFKSIDSEIKEDDIILNEEDESIITIRSISNDGVLDNNELEKISTILEEESNDFDNEVSQKDLNDISEIIDSTLNDIEDYDFNKYEDSKNRLILNNYNISELKPFLQRLDQGLIDKLANGEDVELTLSLKVEN